MLIDLLSGLTEDWLACEVSNREVDVTKLHVQDVCRSEGTR